MTAMREIKFRGRDEHGVWHYGGLYINDDAKYAAILKNRWINFEVVYETVGQFTGLKDITGADIYEGDILSNGRDTVAVSYSIEFAAFVGLYNGREDLVLNLDDCIDQPLDELKLKVIGNVYDNPDLLEVAHD